MNTYSLYIDGAAQEDRISKGVHLFIYRASKIPPHVGLLVNGFLYDITSVGPTIDLSVKDFFKTAQKRKTEVLFIQLKLPPVDNIRDLVSSIVKKHVKVTPTKSCLVPVKEFISNAYGVDVSRAKFIFELLPLIHHYDLVDEILELNLSKKIKNSVFEMSKYTDKEVENCIAALTRKSKFSC